MNLHTLKVIALQNLMPQGEWSVTGEEVSFHGVQEVSESEIQAKIAELEAAEPMRQLREQRNQLLTETDWRFRSDLTPSQAWIDYCQALRDITTQTPSLDENGQLTGINWPTPPND